MVFCKTGILHNLLVIGNLYAREYFIMRIFLFEQYSSQEICKHLQYLNDNCKVCYELINLVSKMMMFASQQCTVQKKKSWLNYAFFFFTNTCPLSIFTLCKYPKTILIIQIFLLQAESSQRQLVVSRLEKNQKKKEIF